MSAKVTIKEFADLACKFPPEITIFGRGDTGIGKSQIVAAISKKLNLPIIDWRLSLYQEGDILGLPKIDEEKESTRFLLAERFMQAVREPHILLLDEFNRAEKPVLQIAFQIVLDRCLDNKKLHKDTRIIALGNIGNDFDVADLEPALLRRLWIADIEPSVEEWIDWAKPTHYRSIISYVSANPNDLRVEFTQKNKRQKDTVYPYPASWSRLNDTLKYMCIDIDKPVSSSDRALISKVSQGFLGFETGPKFAAWVANNTNRKTVSDILDTDNHSQLEEMAYSDKLDLLDRIADLTKKENLSEEQCQNLAKFLTDQITAESMLTFQQRVLASKNRDAIKLINKWISPLIVEASKTLSSVKKGLK